RERSYTNPYLARLVSLRECRPKSIIAEDSIAYLNVLERFLEDRAINESEGALLVDLAINWGLSRECIRSLHHQFLEDLGRGKCQRGKLIHGGQSSQLESIVLVG